jgi:prepilin-type N-terminal cleavage/methylation domain-containing protein
MATHKRQSGMTLTEILVVVTVMAILLGISVPTAQHLMDSFESSTGVRYLINAALSNARAIAVRNQAYAGVRFQEGLDGFTYMTFIIYDKEATGDADGFKAVAGRKPMKLPQDIRVVDIGALNRCSVVFSPAGKLTIHSVQCLPASPGDTIFNSNGLSMFSSDAGDSSSVQSFRIHSKDDYTDEHISPYTGEIVMEYREDMP